MDSPTRRGASLLHQAQASRLQHTNAFDALHVIEPKIRATISSLKTRSSDLPPDVNTVTNFVLDQSSKALKTFESLHAMEETQWNHLEAIASVVDQCAKMTELNPPTKIEQMLFYGKLKTLALELLQSLSSLGGNVQETCQQDWIHDDTMWSKYVSSSTFLNDVDQNDTLDRHSLAIILKAIAKTYPPSAWMNEAMKILRTDSIYDFPDFIPLCDIDVDATPVQTTKTFATYCARYNGKRVHLNKLLDCSSAGEERFESAIHDHRNSSIQHPNLVHVELHCTYRPWMYFVSDRPDYGSWHTFCSVIKPSFTVKRELLLQAAQGLQHLHANHIVHHHVSLDNIVVCGTPDGMYQVKWRWGVTVTKYIDSSEDAVGDVKSLAHCILQAHDCDVSPPSKPDAMSPSEWSLVESMLLGELSMDEVVDTMEIDVAASRPKMTHSSSIHHLLAASKSFKEHIHRSSEATSAKPSEISTPAALDAKDVCIKAVESKKNLADRLRSLVGKPSGDLTSLPVPQRTQEKRPRTRTARREWTPRDKKQLKTFCCAALSFMIVSAGILTGGIYLERYLNSEDGSSNSTNITTVKPLASRVYSITQVAGNGSGSPVDGPLSSAVFQQLDKITGNTDGTELFVVDYNMLRKIDLINHIVETYDLNTYQFLAYNASSLSNFFHFPLDSIVWNATDTIYGSLSSYSIYNISLGYTYMSYAYDTATIAMHNNELYGANTTDVFYGINGTRTHITSMCTMTACPSAVSALAITPNGTIYLLDGPQNRILKRKPTDSDVTIIGSNSSRSIFDNPTGIAADLEGNIFVADFGNHRIQAIDPDDHIYTIATNTTQSVDGSRMFLNEPKGIFCDSNGTLFVTDSQNAAIYKLTYQ